MSPEGAIRKWKLWRFEETGQALSETGPRTYAVLEKDNLWQSGRLPGGREVCAEAWEKQRNGTGRGK